jgi:glutamate-5-semialdehyde dehydrogenase
VAEQREKRLATVTEDLQSYCQGLASRAKIASQELALLPAAAKNRWLLACANSLQSNAPALLAANVLDIAAAPGYGLAPAAIDRLRLDEQRLSAMADGLRQIAALPDPIGELLEGQVRPNGLQIQKVRVPLGTVLFIYESRPNVTADAAAICVKSGNAVILRGGKEALHSSTALVALMNEVAEQCDIPPGAVQMVQTTDRDAVGYLLRMSSIDVAIPRGGKGLIDRVVSEACMPVIKHFDGNCHVFIDKSALPKQAIDILINSKCHRMGVCNACESLLMHHSLAASLLPQIAEELHRRGVEIRGDERTCELIPNAIPATKEDWYAEYLGPVISCRVVSSLDEAIDHINHYGSHHTDAIVTQDLTSAREFTQRVDSAAVMVNASTRFNDGGEFGMGAEIGISTDKFHARGPCGLKELTSYKYVVYGNGQIRS